MADLEKYPYYSLNGEFFDKDFLDSVREHLIVKARLVHGGLDTMTPTDKLAYHVLKMISMKGFN